MEIKLFELRDRATFIPVLALRLQIAESASNEAWLLRRAGYAREDVDVGSMVLLVTLSGGRGHATCDAYDWNSETYTTAHRHIIDHWPRLESGQVIDVEYIRGESSTPKPSERLLDPFGD